MTFPETPQEIAAIVQCARECNLKLQARSGGHSYANFGLGGDDGAVVVDLKHFQHFSMDTSTCHATIGAGTLLGDVTKKLHDAGGRAIAHGTCPAVGIGGHATIGGLGPRSRQFGTMLDHVEEVEVVLANGSIARASWSENADLFFALKGAAAGFGIITEFRVRTEAEPAKKVQYSFALHQGKYGSMADDFKAWQRMISDPSLPRMLASQIIVNQLGMLVSGTFYGSEEEWEEVAMNREFFQKRSKEYVVLDDWLGHVAHLADEATLLLGTGLPTPIYCKSLAFKNSTLIPDETIDELFDYFDKADKGSPLWFAYFDRDVLFYMQSYVSGLDWGHVSPTSKNFIRGIADTITHGMPEVDFGVYAGYVDPELENAQEKYWGANLRRLEEIKLKYDPADIFSNPQSVRPAKAAPNSEGHDEL